jgi:hypothetical protein
VSTRLSFSEIKRPECEADHSHPSGVEVLKILGAVYDFLAVEINSYESQYYVLMCRVLKI